MTKKQMRFIAGRKLALHWVKLYCPKRITEWETGKKPEQLPGEFEASLAVMSFMDGGGSTGFRLLTLIQAVDIRETRQLCLGEPVPGSLAEEARFLLKEAGDLLESSENAFKEHSGETVEFAPP